MKERSFPIAGLIFATAVVLPFSFHAKRQMETAAQIQGGEAERVILELAARFRSPFVDRVVLGIRGLPSADSDEGQQALTTIVAGLREERRRIRSSFPSPVAVKGE